MNDPATIASTEDSVEYKEACALALAIYKRRYQTQSPNFELCPDTVGVITQIDNMVAGLFQDADRLRAELKAVKRFNRQLHGEQL